MFQNWTNAHQNMVALTVVCIIVMVLYIVREGNQKISFWGLIVFTLFVLYKTVFSRKQADFVINLDLGWSYKAMLNDVPGMFSQIYLNIMFFIPVGIFSEQVFFNKYRNSYLLSFFYGLILTVIVESLQLLFNRGIFELDDILNNAIGTIIGILIALMINKRGDKNKR